jgi:hypothetical protein
MRAVAAYGAIGLPASKAAFLAASSAIVFFSSLFPDLIIPTSRRFCPSLILNSYVV